MGNLYNQCNYISILLSSLVLLGYAPFSACVTRCNQASGESVVEPERRPRMSETPEHHTHGCMECKAQRTYTVEPCTNGNVGWRCTVCGKILRLIPGRSSAISSLIPAPPAQPVPLPETPQCQISLWQGGAQYTVGMDGTCISTLVVFSAFDHFGTGPDGRASTVSWSLCERHYEQLTTCWSCGGLESLGPYSLTGVCLHCVSAAQ